LAKSGNYANEQPNQQHPHAFGVSKTQLALASKS
jgi:hypothetical protein